ncbi:MAG: DNA primase [Bacteroidales bacterium]|nr:DNA primase [Bacteroidales bacterium]
MISKETIDEIYAAAQIEEVVADFVPLKRRGQNWVGVCPFHNDKNPSMYVSPRLGIFNCFVCHTGGNAVNFVMKHEQISYPEALRYLAKKYGINIVEDARSEDLTDEEKLKESLLAVNKFAEQYFIDQLLNTEEGQTIGLSYFKERGFTQQTIEKFRLGYCPDGWDKFTQEALKNGYQLEHLIMTGLTKQSESGKIFDFYRGRVIFPIYDKLGKPVGFGGRILKKDEKTAKYFNSPESPIYHKSNVLYGFYQAQRAIKSQDNVYLVEGYTDVLSMVQAGIENVVATSGTAFPDGQIRLLKSKTNNVTVLRDGDKAGINAALKDINILLGNGFNVSVVMLPDGEDPDSFAQGHRDSEITDYLKDNADSFILFKARVMAAEAGNDPAKRAAMVKDIIQSIALIQDDITKQLYIKELSKVFNLEEKFLTAELRKNIVKNIKDIAKKESDQDINIHTKPEENVSSNDTTITDTDSLASIEEKIILLLLHYGAYEIDAELLDDEGNTICQKIRLDQYIFNDFTEEGLSFQQPLFQKIFEEYAVIAEKSSNQDDIKKAFVNHEDAEIQQFALEHLMKEEIEISPEWQRRFEVSTDHVNNSCYKLNEEVYKTVLMFKYRFIDQFLDFLMSEIKKDPPEKILDNLLRKCDVLNKRKAELGKLMDMVIAK